MRGKKQRNLGRMTNLVREQTKYDLGSREQGGHFREHRAPLTEAHFRGPYMHNDPGPCSLKVQSVTMVTRVTFIVPPPVF